MPKNLVMPRLSDTMEEGTVARWLKQEGEEFISGDLLAEIDTDKATMPLEAFQAGRLEKILVPEGQSAPVGEPIAQLALSGAATDSGVEAETTGNSSERASDVSSRDASPVEPNIPHSARVPETEETETAPSEYADETTGSGGVTEAPGGSEKRADKPGAMAQHDAAPVAPSNEGRVRASPMARRVAAELGVRLEEIQGTGPGGRVLHDDVERAASAKAKPTEATPVPAPGREATVGDVFEQSRVQAVIARRMVESKTTIPHFYVTMEIAMEAAMQFRRDANRALPENQSLTINDLIVKAAALALREFPDVNASYRNGKIERHRSINVGFAVATSEGLFVPVIRDSDRKSLREIASESRALIERTRSGRLTAADYESGTFTVSNLGMYDVLDFAAIVNPPQAAILAVGSVRQQPVVKDGALAVGERMHVTLSGDHRVFYGAMGAEFLREIRRLLETPMSLVL
jgi:pyruvate dehydrogenase E2 component (dihydrolipoamide acetyltransferase)